MDQEGQQGKTEQLVLVARLSEKEKKGKWYLRNAATFKDIRSGEHGLELFKGNMPGHEDKYDWTYKELKFIDIGTYNSKGSVSNNNVQNLNFFTFFTLLRLLF